ncbi:hypothetical protein BH10ACI2_BH10ACI2_25650 [soil metagenome]
MRILIGYNGSEPARAAVLDLRHAGLPAEAEAIVLSVVEASSVLDTAEKADFASYEGKIALKNLFPQWKVEAEIARGFPANEILDCALSFQPDLIVVGEHRAKFDETSFPVGQTSQKVLTEADCTVRVSRGASDSDIHSERILVGFDGSAGSLNAVNTISSRTWKNKPDVRLLAVADASFLMSIGRFTPQISDAAVEARFASQWAETLAAASLEKLRNAGVTASVVVKFGHPKETIVKEAENWHADAIYVGPHCNCNSFERFLLGSVSSAVAAQAACSVEVVRAPET